jgi:hypothetical protein
MGNLRGQKHSGRTSVAALALLGALPLLTALLLAGCSPAEKPKDSGLESLTWAILAGLNDLYTQHVGGRPEGAQDATGECTFGGSVRVKGTTSVEPDGTQRQNLIYTMTACHVGPVSSDGQSHADLVLDGVVTSEGVTTPTTADLVYRSDALSFVGRVDSGEVWWNHDRTCALSVNQQDAAVNGLICGENVAW